MACLTALACHASARPSYGQRKAARKFANTGLTAYRKGEYQKALSDFQAAENIVHAPPHLLYQARCQTKLGALLEARALYGRVIDEKLPRRPPRAFVRAQKQAAKEREKLEARIPRLSVELSTGPAEGASLQIDGEAQEGSWSDIALDPGEHQLRVTADGFEPADRTVTLTEGAQESVALELIAVPPPAPEEEPSKPFPTLPVAVLGAGAVALVIGTATGVAALGRASELNDTCPSNPCPTENEPLADEANALATVSTVGFVLGGLAVAGGGAWLVFDMMHEPDTASDDAPEEGLEAISLRPLIGPGYAGVRGSF